jgi:hypothetical protein
MPAETVQPKPDAETQPEGAEPTNADDDGISLDSAIDRASIKYSKRHQEVLAKRGVPEDLARAYFLRSCGEKQIRDGLGRKSFVGSALKIPSTGDGSCPRYRVDEPEKNGGARYLTPAGREIGPFILRTVAVDSDEPIYLVEAPLKALSMCAHGFAATIGLGGVDAGAFQKGTRDLHVELKPYIRPGRRINIVFDGGRVHKLGVARAEARLAAGLRAAGADVWLVELAPVGDNRDPGPDDFLVANGADALRALVAKAVPSDPLAHMRIVTDAEEAERLLRHLPYLAALRMLDDLALDLIVPELKRLKLTKKGLTARLKEFDLRMADFARDKAEKAGESAGAPASGQYRVEDGRLCMVRVDPQGNEVLVALANFAAKIVEDVLYDDGASQERVFVIEGALDNGTPLPVAQVRHAEFSALAWVYREWGARAAPAAGRSAADQLREAIQEVSSPVQRTVYRHTGWRDLAPGRTAFLFHGGAVGADGVGVELSGNLRHYALPPPVIGGLPDSLVRLVLSLLDVGPDEIGAALLCAVALAPLVTEARPGFALFLLGPTGSLKTELGAIAQSFFGAGFGPQNPPGNWTSTSNALEAQLHAAKDVLFLCDDYAPQATHRAHLAMQEKAQSVIRSAGNASARGRLNRETVLRPDRPPRGLLVSTGEELPPGASILARVVRVDVERKLVNLAVLSALQAQRDALSTFTAHYVQHLSVKMRREPLRLQERAREKRDLFTGMAGHLRQPDAFAKLEVAFEELLDVLKSDLVIDDNEADALLRRVHHALLVLATKNAENTANACPSRVFLGVLSTLIRGGRAKLAAKGTDLAMSSSTSCQAVGWDGDGFAYLDPAIAREAVLRFCQASDVSFNVSEEQLVKLLDQRGLVERPSSGDRILVSVRIGKQVVRALKVKMEHLRASVADGVAIRSDEVHAYPLDGVDLDESAAAREQPN